MTLFSALIACTMREHAENDVHNGARVWLAARVKNLLRSSGHAPPVLLDTSQSEDDITTPPTGCGQVWFGGRGRGGGVKQLKVNLNRVNPQNVIAVRILLYTGCTQSSMSNSHLQREQGTRQIV